MCNRNNTFFPITTVSLRYSNYTLVLVLKSHSTAWFPALPALLAGGNLNQLSSVNQNHLSQLFIDKLSRQSWNASNVVALEDQAALDSSTARLSLKC